ncbi:predicted protein [Sclerotinia sclerotiorum 1980 UF-70]|uniref:Uncharacterized protein n=1 Tax=Sclerotinia sclerotiorum (strain ATCC 18683 / 1980 / Ss-1) TaxID=665079 RepID=A7F7Z8_SCLS1|nr:predicted protein [Sclerotinia sclerotiorum 1980 UF-70]EDN98869.1 predicted protein [Sclerotinia sclerotiorum 1980 UF-70]
MTLSAYILCQENSPFSYTGYSGIKSGTMYASVIPASSPIKVPGIKPKTARKADKTMS